MGYSTSFSGTIGLSRPLTVREHRTLTEFSRTRHDDNVGPGIWCDFAPNADGTGIVWTGKEKTYDAVEWVRYLVDTYLNPWGIAANGGFQATGESPGDNWFLDVFDNEVKRFDARIVRADEVTS